MPGISSKDLYDALIMIGAAFALCIGLVVLIILGTREIPKK